MTATVLSSVEENREMYWKTLKSVDLTPYSKLRIYANGIGDPSYGGGFVYIQPKIAGSSDNASVAYTTINTTDYQVIELDVSNITGSYYINPRFWLTYNKSVSCSIRKIWLE